MVVYILDKKEFERVAIQEVNEQKNDLRIGVYDIKKKKPLKIFPKGELKKAIKFGENYVKKKYGGLYKSKK